MPYHANQLIFDRFAAVVTEPHLKEIHSISSLFVVNGENEMELEKKVEEFFWVCTLLHFVQARKDGNQGSTSS